MKPTVILFTDTNPDYLFLLPIVAKSWELQGFYPVCKIESRSKIPIIDKWMKLSNSDVSFFLFSNIYGLLPPSLVQIMRPYTACKSLDNDNNYIVLSDVDMFIGSNFLYRDFDKINVFGHDLTGHEHIPMCYVGMSRDRWIEVMGVRNYDYQPEKKHVHDDIKKYGSLNQWVWDQDILTGRLKEYGYDKINFINRGIDKNNSGLPLGRCDRYNNMKMPFGQIHDVHLMRNPMSEENTAKIIKIASLLYPLEDWSWIVEYRKEFINTLK